MKKFVIGFGVGVNTVVGIIALAVGGLFAGAFTTSHPYTSSVDVTTTTSGQRTVTKNVGYVRTGWEASFKNGQVILTHLRLDSMTKFAFKAENVTIDTPSVATQTISLNIANPKAAFTQAYHFFQANRGA